jgi:hypothetical protein
VQASDRVLAVLALLGQVVVGSPGLTVRAMERLADRGSIASSLPSDFADLWRLNRNSGP